MNNYIKLILLTTTIPLLSACVEVEDTNYSQDYYSSSGYVTTDQSDVTTGYNRDYQPPRAPKQQQVTTNTQQTPDGSYSSSQTPNSGYSSTQTAGGGYSSTATPAQSNNADGYL